MKVYVFDASKLRQETASRFRCSLAFADSHLVRIELFHADRGSPYRYRHFSDSLLSVRIANRGVAVAAVLTHAALSLHHLSCGASCRDHASQRRHASPYLFTAHHDLARNRRDQDLAEVADSTIGARQLDRPNSWIARHGHQWRYPACSLARCCYQGSGAGAGTACEPVRGAAGEGL